MSIINTLINSYSQTLYCSRDRDNFCSFCEKKPFILAKKKKIEWFFDDNRKFFWGTISNLIFRVDFFFRNSLLSFFNVNLSRKTQMKSHFQSAASSETYLDNSFEAPSIQDISNLKNSNLLSSPETDSILCGL